MINLLTRLDLFDSIRFDFLHDSRLDSLLTHSVSASQPSKTKARLFYKKHHHKISNSKQKTQTDDDDDNNITFFFCLVLMPSSIFSKPKDPQPYWLI